MAKEQIKIKQFMIGHYTAADGNRNFSVIALSDNGKLYKFDSAKKGAIPYKMYLRDEEQEEDF
jgi:hypothetical protein